MQSGNRLKTLAAGIALAALIAPAAAQSVKVNGKEIPQSRIDVGVKSRIAQGQPDTPELRNTVKDALINQEIIAQEAVKKGLNKKPDVAAAIEINRQDILVNAYVQDYLQKNPVKDDTLKQEYERIKTQVGGKEYKARHILVENEAEAKDIIAQIKKGQGLVVHTHDCPAIHPFHFDPEKWVEVQWDTSSDRFFDVNVRLIAQNHRGVLARLAAEVSEADSNIDHIETEQRASPAYTTVVFTIQVKNRMHLAHVFRRLRRIPEVVRITRLKKKQP